MKKYLLFIGLITFLGFNGMSQKKNFSDKEILAMYSNLRVADVSDGMDFAGLWDQGLVDKEISAIWKDYDSLDHIFRGIALTIRYVPANDTLPDKMSKGKFNDWVGSTYVNTTPEPFVDSIKEGTAIVMDAGGNGEAGIVGSYNSLEWKRRGMVGLIANGGVRDTDEIAKQKIPVYMDWVNRGRGIRPGRNKFESMNEPVTIGSVVIYPGDVIIADGDGVIVVPRAFAKKVADYANEVLKADKKARRDLYKKMGKEMDQTVKESK